MIKRLRGYHLGHGRAQRRLGREERLRRALAEVGFADLPERSRHRAERRLVGLPAGHLRDMARYTKANGHREHARASTSATTPVTKPATKQHPSHNDPVGTTTFLSTPQRLAAALQLGACVPPPLEVLRVHVPDPRVVGHLPTSRAPQALRRAQPK